MVRMTEQNMFKGTAYVDFVTLNHTVILRYSFMLRVFSDILWSNCFERYGLKDTDKGIKGM